MNVNPLLPKLNPNTFLQDYLTAKGVKDVKAYLTADMTESIESPWSYPNMQDAVKLLKKHISCGQMNDEYVIGILIDSDVDGYASAAIAYMFLKLFGVTAKVFWHTLKQHGLGDVVQQVIEADCKLIIVPDAGTNDIDACKELQEHNIDVLVADHHIPEKENPYCVLINHHLGEDLNTALSGTGVMYKVVEAYCEAEGMVCPDYYDIVALSLVSDSCNISTMENRAILNYGMNNPTNPFLKYMFEKKCKQGVDSHSIAFGVVPLGNALARMDEQDTKLLFFDALAGNNEYTKSLTDIGRVKRKQDEAVKQAMEEIEPTLDLNQKVLVGFTESDNKGWIGLIANKFTSKYGKPTVLLREMDSTTWTGSLRSPVDIADKINASKLAVCRGHLAACGITVKKSKLKKLQALFDTLNLSANPNVEVTAIANVNDLTVPLCEQCMHKQLWGKGMEQPTLFCTLHSPKVDVFEKTTTTIKLTDKNVAFLLFRAKEQDVKALSDLKGKDVQVVVTLETNEWNDVVSPQATIQRYEVVDSCDEIEDDEWEDFF